MSSPVWKSSIQAKIGITLILITTAILSGYSAYQYFTLHAEKMADLHELGNHGIDRVVESLIKPLWDADERQINKVVLSEMREKTLFTIIIRDDDRTLLAGKMRDRNWQLVDVAENLPDTYLPKRQAVTKDGETLRSLPL